MRDSTPSKEAAFLAFARRFAAAAARLKAERTAYETADAGKVGRGDRKEKRKAPEADIRKAKRAYIDADPPVAATDEIRLDFGLPPAGPSKANIPAPTEIAAFTLEHGGYLQAAAFCKAGGPEPVKFGEPDSSKPPTRPAETITFKDAGLGRRRIPRSAGRTGRASLVRRLRYRERRSGDAE